MQDFCGYIEEFPEIRGKVAFGYQQPEKLFNIFLVFSAVDYFKSKKGVKPPTFIFLSHYHSDHLTGLENRGISNLTFCSAATKEVS